MSTNPRNPRYFPNMKIRGAKRRLIAPLQILAGAFDHLGTTAQVAAKALARAFR